MSSKIKWKPIKYLTEKQIVQFLNKVRGSNVELHIQDIEYNEILDRVEVRVCYLCDTTNYDGSIIKSRFEECLFFTSDEVKGSDGLNFTKEWQDFSIQNYFHPIYKNRHMISLLEKIDKRAFIRGYVDGYKNGHKMSKKDFMFMI